MQQNNEPQTNSENDPSFQKKVWITTGIVAFALIMLMVLKATFSVLLLVLAGTLIAIYFRWWSNLIERKTKWKEWVCVAIPITVTILLVAGSFWLIGEKVQTQVVELVETLPKTIDNAKATLNDSSIGRKIIDRLSSESSMNKARVFATQFFQSTFGVLGDVYVILFIGIFFTISPRTYTNGMVQLIPVKGQKKAKKIVDELGGQLANWLKGKLFSMFVVFVLTAIGLAIIGMPLWLVLALLAGSISFIPNFGPLLAFIPALLVALMQSPQTAALVAGLYVVIQFVESNFITPFVQKKLINMPPALIIIAQLVMGALTGAWGLILATPLVVIVIVLVQQLYLKNRS